MCATHPVPLFAVLQPDEQSPMQSDMMCPMLSVPLLADGLDPLSPPSPRLAVALTCGALPVLEALIRRTAQEPEGFAAVRLWHLRTGASNTLHVFLAAALAHGREREAAALAASLAKGARLELARAGQQQQQPREGLLVGLLGACAVRLVPAASQPDSPALRQLCGLLCGMVGSLGAAFAAGLAMPRIAVTADQDLRCLAWGYLWSTGAAGFLAVASHSGSAGSAAGSTASGASEVAVGGGAVGGGSGAVPAASLSWPQMLLQLRPFELLQRCFQVKGLGPIYLHKEAITAASVTLALPAETRTAVRSVGGNGAAAPLQPAVLRRLATALQDAEKTEAAVVAAATAALWEAWQASPLVDAAREAELLSELRAALGWRQPQLPLPSPAEALALLRPCGNPLCMELGGDSEARVQLKACARCGAVAYCCRCAEGGGKAWVEALLVSSQRMA
jgi:hypothetical protein